jgi:hypothetical protein
MNTMKTNAEIKAEIRVLEDHELDAVQGGYAGLLVVLIAAMGAGTAAWVDHRTGSGKGSSGTW